MPTWNGTRSTDSGDGLAGDPRDRRDRSLDTHGETLRTAPARVCRFRPTSGDPRRYWPRERPARGHRDGAVQRHRGVDVPGVGPRRALGPRRCRRSAALCGRRGQHTAGSEMGTEGDSFFVVFGVRARRRARRRRRPAGAAGSTPGRLGARIRVRMGLHTGEPQRHEEGYIGLDVHRGARISGHRRTAARWCSRRRPPSWSPTSFRSGSGISPRPGLAPAQGPRRSPSTSTTWWCHGLLGHVPAAAQPRHRRRACRGRSRLWWAATTRFTGCTPALGRETPGWPRSPGRAARARPGWRWPTAFRLADALAGVFFVLPQQRRRQRRAWSVIAETVGAGGSATAEQPRAGRCTCWPPRPLLLVLDNLEQIDGADVVLAELLARPARSSGSWRPPGGPLHLAAEHEFAARSDGSATGRRRPGGSP